MQTNWAPSRNSHIKGRLNSIIMKFVIIFGPLAVGKMTVGQELERITGLKLFHNHFTIELLLPFFDMRSASFEKLVNSFRMQLFEEFAKSDAEGLIFTYAWELDQDKDWQFVNQAVDIFERKNARICYVELQADVEERLVRNRSPNRLRNKPSKRDLCESERELMETDEKYILNSQSREFQGKDHYKIDNTHIGAKQAARLIKERFSL